MYIFFLYGIELKIKLTKWIFVLNLSNIIELLDVSRFNGFSISMCKFFTKIANKKWETFLTQNIRWKFHSHYKSTQNLKFWSSRKFHFLFQHAQNNSKKLIKYSKFNYRNRRHKLKHTTFLHNPNFSFANNFLCTPIQQRLKNNERFRHETFLNIHSESIKSGYEVYMNVHSEYIINEMSTCWTYLLPHNTRLD